MYSWTSTGGGIKGQGVVKKEKSDSTGEIGATGCSLPDVERRR